MLADARRSNVEEDNAPEFWRRVIKHNKYMHISENHRGIPGSVHACTAEIFQTLREGGYDRLLTIEAFGWSVQNLVGPLHPSRRFFQKKEDVAVLRLQYIRSAWENVRPRRA